MGYDKVVDSSALNAGLTQIANAIREKGGTSAKLSFPDGMTQAIAGIQTGGSGGCNIATNTYYPIEDFKTATFSHNLGVIPKLFILRVIGNTSSNLTHVNEVTYFSETQTDNICRYQNMFSFYKTDAANFFSTIDENKVVINVASKIDRSFPATSYEWIAIG